MDDSRFSLAEVFDVRVRAFAEISEHTKAIDAIAAAIAELDHALQVCIAEHDIADQQNVITAARLLSDAMAGRQA